MKKDSFYIGWMAAAPKPLTAFLRKYLLFLFPAACILAFLLTFFQKKSGTGNFEFGQLTEVQGVYFAQPVPRLRVSTGKNIWGEETSLTITLIGYGKFGANGILHQLEEEKEVSLNGKLLTLKGTLLYNDGKTLLQLNAADHPLVKLTNAEQGVSIKTIEFGTQTLSGEIVDPKCYFGVMKPGEGKAHRDCAVRCIYGGMPPVLATKSNAGEMNYYYVVGPNGETLNEQLKDFIAEPQMLTGRVAQLDDWLVLYLDDASKLHHLSWLERKYGNQIISCSTECMK